MVGVGLLSPLHRQLPCASQAIVPLPTAKVRVVPGGHGQKLPAHKGIKKVKPRGHTSARVRHSSPVKYLSKPHSKSFHHEDYLIPRHPFRSCLAMPRTRRNCEGRVRRYL